MAAFALMLLGKADVVVMERVRAGVIDSVSPVLEVISRPVASFESVVKDLTALGQLRAVNLQLKTDNQNLLEWQSAARKLAAENTQLKTLLNFAPGAEPGFVSGRVIADTGGAFVHSILVNAGRREGITKGQAVVTGEGLVGRVHGVGSRSVRVLLITDLNSRIPVVIEATRTRAVLAGDNTEHPRLIHLPPGVVPNPGDRIVTSGHGGAFPPGIPVGVISRSADGIVPVKTYVHRDRLEYVRIVNYGLQGILDAAPAAKGDGVSR
ncbi:MAG: rod shape-determining protein MreC [Magnetovibrio sp.]|nr:rod shape-determining protein MreC [Magnetovibrio sp.]